MKVNNTTIEIIRGSVIDQDVEAIVNAANSAMRGGGGVDGAIHRAAGRELLEELKRVAPNGAETGTAVLTSGHGLKQRYVIHTPGPRWHGGHHGEPGLLASCYRSCLEVAATKKMKSIAFCSISTGIYGYPLERAAPQAIETVRSYLSSHSAVALERVVFAMFQAEEYEVFSRALAAAGPEGSKEAG